MKWWYTYRPVLHLGDRRWWLVERRSGASAFRHGGLGFLLVQKNAGEGKIFGFYRGRDSVIKLSCLIALINERHAIFSLLMFWCFFLGLELELDVRFAWPGDRFVAVAVVSNIYLLLSVFTPSCMPHVSSFSLDFCISSLIHIPVFLVKLKPVNLLACMTGMIYASRRKPSPTFLERQFTWLSDFPKRHHIFQLF